MKTGTWWLSNWISNKNNNTQVGIQLAKCKSRPDCACNLTELSSKDSTTRIIKPASGDCTLGMVRFKRSRNELIVWSKSGTKRYDNSQSRRGSMPRKYLTGKRRRPSQTVDTTMNPDTDNKARKLFGGSGAKFATLRNRRGGQGGRRWPVPD